MPSRNAGDTPGDRSPSTQTLVRRPSRMSPYERERYEHRLLRRLAWDYKIESTAKLVQAFNEVQDSEERKILFKWLQEFAEKAQETRSIEATIEYTQLAKIKPRNDRAERLLRSLFSDIRHAIPENEDTKPEIAKALHEALLSAHRKVIDDDTLLMPLAIRLMRSLSPHPDLQAVDFERYRPTFVALHLIVFYLREMCYTRLYPEDKRSILKEVSKKRIELRNSFNYYPLRFHFALIEQSIQRLGTTDNCIFRALRCLTLGYCCGILLLLHTSTEPVHLSIEPDALEKRLDASAENAPTCPAHQYASIICLLQDLEAARVLVVRGGDNVLDIFFKGLDAVVEIQSKRRREVDLKILRCGALYELSQIMIHGNENAQKRAEERFMTLTKNRILEEGWIEDDDVFEVFFEEVLRIRAKGERVADIESLLQELPQRFDSLGKKSISHRIKFDQKLESNRVLQREQGKRMWYQGLCCQVGQEMGYIPVDEIASNIEYLKERYCNSENVTVPPPIGQGEPFHVDKMQHAICVHEPELGSNDESGGRQLRRRSAGVAQEQGSQSQKVLKRISLEDLFNPFEDQTGQAADIRRVLLYGDPGTGKTCIAKSVAHKWATGKLGNRFEMVYVLPVRKLNRPSEDVREWDIVASTIVNMWYSDRHNSMPSTLLTQVNDDLDNPKTLLILDGLDEGNKEAREIVSDIKRKECSLLTISRPHNLYDERRYADRELECMGFDKEQQTNYVQKILNGEQGEKLIDSVGSCPVIAEIMRIPMMLYIVCTLWREGELGPDDENQKRSMYSLITKMVNYVWARFSSRPNMEKVDRGEIFSWLEKISFEAWRNDQHYISQLIVTRQTTDSDVWEILKHNGLLFFSTRENQYRFPHNTFQEYFVGRHLAHCLQSPEKKIRNSVVSTIESGRYLGKYRVSVSFAIQSLAEQNKVQTFLHVISLVDKETPEMIGIQHFLLKLRILNAWLAGAVDSVTNELLKNESIVRLVDTVSCILAKTDPTTALWDIATRAFRKLPNIFNTFSEVLDSVIETSRLEKLVDEYRFGHVVRLLKYSPKHWEKVYEQLKQKLRYKRGKEIVRGVKMAKCLIRIFPGDRCNDLYNLLEQKCVGQADCCVDLVVVKAFIWNALVIHCCKDKHVKSRFKDCTEEIRLRLWRCLGENEDHRLEHNKDRSILGTALLLFSNWCWDSDVKNTVEWLENWCKEKPEAVRLVTNALLDCACLQSDKSKHHVSDAYERWLECEENEDEERTSVMKKLFARTREEFQNAKDIVSKLESESHHIDENVGLQAAAAMKALKRLIEEDPDVLKVLKDLLDKRAEPDVEEAEESEAETSKKHENKDKHQSGCHGKLLDVEENGDGFQGPGLEDVRRVFDNAIQERGENDTTAQSLLNLLIEVPVTVGPEARDGTLRLTAHLDRYETVGSYPRNAFYPLHSKIMDLFAKDYPELPRPFNLH